jgi:hypothetical protein
VTELYQSETFALVYIPAWRTSLILRSAGVDHLFNLDAVYAKYEPFNAPLHFAPTPGRANARCAARYVLRSADCPTCARFDTSSSRLKNGSVSPISSCPARS